MGNPSNVVANSIKHKLKSLIELSSDCCIYRSPDNLRKVNEEAYRPLVVSIGSLYYNDQRVAATEEQKLRYLQSFLGRGSAYDVGHYAECSRELEQVARECYIKTLNLPSDLFIEMVPIDAAFIIELFLRDYFHELIDENDRIFNKPMIIVAVTRDLRLEENQLPLFIIMGLYGLAFGTSTENNHISFIDLTYSFLMGRKETVPHGITTIHVTHFVDFLKVCYLPSTLRGHHPTNINQGFVFPSSVVELSEAGVKFVARKSEHLLDIRFTKGGVLEIPRLVLTDDTESLFRNIMVFEQCHYYFDSYIIDYFAFLNGLINTPKDVEILVESGVIENWLGFNKEVANLFSNVFKYTWLRGANFYYSGVCVEIVEFARTLKQKKIIVSTIHGR